MNVTIGRLTSTVTVAEGGAAPDERLVQAVAQRVLDLLREERRLEEQRRREGELRDRASTD